MHTLTQCSTCVEAMTHEDKPEQGCSSPHSSPHTNTHLSKLIWPKATAQALTSQRSHEGPINALSLVDKKARLTCYPGKAQATGLALCASSTMNTTVLEQSSGLSMDSPGDIPSDMIETHASLHKAHNLSEQAHRTRIRLDTATASLNAPCSCPYAVMCPNKGEWCLPAIKTLDAYLHINGEVSPLTRQP